jgi:adsorption protein B
VAVSRGEAFAVLRPSKREADGDAMLPVLATSQLAAIRDSYFHVFDILTVIVVLTILLSSTDDAFIDAYYWVREAYRRFVIRARYPRLTLQELRSKEERWFAVMVPAWNESPVIAQMIEHTIAALEYRKFVIFVGTYQNDPETTAEVERMVRRYPGLVERATVKHDGPSCKADCLNWIVQSVFAHEERLGIEFVGLATHDCEDIVHPLELYMFNYLVDRKDFIQLPVLSLERKWSDFVAGTYLDDFSEWHSKDMRVRESLTGLVPGAGVASCYSRRIIGILEARAQHEPFSTDSLTEDYDTSFRMWGLGAKMAFVWMPVSYTARRRHLLTGAHRDIDVRSVIATRELFPSTFKAAYRQRARWVIGIAFQGTQRFGWRGPLAAKYMYLRDRKGAVTSLVSIMAYVVSANYGFITLAHAHGLLLSSRLVIEDAPHWLSLTMFANTLLLGNRIFQRVYFVGRLNGPVQGLLSIPRLVVNNFINFFAVCRAWRLFIVATVTGQTISWDKTNHVYPSREDLGLFHRKLGELLVSGHTISQAELDAAIDEQAGGAGVPLGRVLMRRRLVDAETLADALAEQAGWPRVRLAAKDWRAVAGRLPLHVAVRCEAIPFELADDGVLHVAVCSAVDAITAAQIRAGAGRPVQFFVACEHEIVMALRWLVHREEVSHRNGTDDARLLGKVLVEQGALKAADLQALVSRYEPVRDGLFGEYLLRRGAINRPDLDTALEEQERGENPVARQSDEATQP